MRCDTCAAAGTTLEQTGTMNTFIWAVLIASAVAIVACAPSGERKRTASWLDLLPYMTASHKQAGRAQQTAAHRRAKTRR
jgi:hypothetical protein